MNKLAKVLEKTAINKVTGPVARFGSAHSTGIATAIAISSNIASNVIIYKNSPEIHDIIYEARLEIEMIKGADWEDDEERDEIRDVYVDTLKRLAPLVGPVIILQATSIACQVGLAVKADKQSKQIAKLTAGISVANAAIEEYNLFRNEAKKVVDEEKIKEVDKTISEEVKSKVKGTEVKEEIRIKSGEKLYLDKWTGRKFSSNKSKIDMGVRLLEARVHDISDDEPVRLNDWLNILGLGDTDACSYLGWPKDKYNTVSFSYYIHGEGVSTEDDVESVLTVTLYPAPEVLFE